MVFIMMRNIWICILNKDADTSLGEYRHFFARLFVAICLEIPWFGQTHLWIQLGCLKKGNLRTNSPLDLIRLSQEREPSDKRPLELT
jgi:hypothetical protein